MANDYKALVESIERIEKSASIGAQDKSAPSLAEKYIDLNSIAKSSQDLKTANRFQNLLIIIDSVERGRAPPKFSESKQRVDDLSTKINTEQKSIQIQQPSPKNQTNSNQKPHIQGISISTKIKASISSELKDASARFSSMNGQPKAQQKQEMEQRDISISRKISKDLVLPNLSIADQISELEKIIEGINENAFDKSHMEIIARELEGLDNLLKMGKNKDGEKQEDPTASLRDLRLSDAITLVKEKGYD